MKQGGVLIDNLIGVSAHLVASECGDIIAELGECGIAIDRTFDAGRFELGKE